MYSCIDVTCIVPPHMMEHTSTSTIEDTEEKCGICKTVINIQEAKSTHSQTNDLLQLSCKHYFHYECLREACRKSKNPKYGRECAICRYPYKPLPLIPGETYVPYFHETIPQEDSHITKLAIDWNTILTGQKVYISKKVSKRKFKTGVFVRQTKQQAEIKFEDGSTARYGKTNLWKINN